MWITISIITCIGFAAQMAFGVNDHKLICSSGALNCSNGQVIHVSSAEASGTEPPGYTYREIITCVLRNCNIRPNCTVNIGGYCLNISYYCEIPDWDVIELVEDQLVSKTIIDNYKLALQSKGYDRGLYQTAFNADCQLSIRGQPDVQPMYLLISLFDFGPYMEFDSTDHIKYCLTIQGNRLKEFCTGDKTLKKPLDKYSKLYMKYTWPNWTVHFSFKWGRDAVADHRRNQNGIGFRLNMAVFLGNHEFGNTVAKELSCKTVSESSAMPSLSNSPLVGQNPFLSVTTLDEVSVTQEPRSAMSRFGEGLRIPSEVLVAVGIIIVIMLFVIVFGIVAFIFRRNTKDKHGPRPSEIQDRDGEERVYEEPDLPPEVPLSERPMIEQIAVGEETTGRPGSLEFHVPLMYRDGAGQEEHKIPCELHSLDIPQARKDWLIANNIMLSAQPEHESFPGYFKMKSPPRLLPCPHHFLDSGIKGICTTEEGPAKEEYMAMALQEGCLAENCTCRCSSDTPAGDLPQVNCEMAHQITVC